MQVISVESLIRSEVKELESLIKRQNSNEAKKFSDVAMSRIEYLNSRLFDHISFLEKYYARYTELVNIRAIYKLQRVTICLTLGAFIIGFLNLLIYWEQLSKVIKCVLNSLYMIRVLIEASL